MPVELKPPKLTLKNQLLALPKNESDIFVGI